MIDRFFGFIGVDKEEQAPLTLLTLRAAAVAVIIVATYVFQGTFFLNIFPPSMLPWLYATVAVITVAFSFPYATLHKKLGERKADTVAMLFFGLGLIPPLFYPSLLIYKPTLFAFSIWVKLVGVFSAISFWHHATRAFPSRRAKTILPIVAAGFSLGSALAGKVIAMVAIHMGSAAILPIIVGSIVLNMAIPMRGVTIEKVVRPRAKRGNIVKRGVNLLATNKLALYLTLFILFTIPAFIGTDFILKKAVRANFDKDGMAAFFANYQLFLNLGVFVLQTLFMGRLMRVLGVSKISAATPLFLILTFPILILSPTLTFALIFAVFSGVLRLTLHVNARNQLITPLSPAEKETASMFLRTIVAPIGTVLTSMALLPLKHSSIQVIASVSLGMSVLFLLTAFKAASAYNSELLHALKKKTLSFDAIDRLPAVPDGAVLQNLRDRVMSPSFEEASFAVSLLAEYDELQLDDLDSFFKKEFSGIQGLLPRLKAIELGLYLKPRDKEAFFKTIFENSDQPEILIEAARITLLSNPEWLGPYAATMLSDQHSPFRRGIALYLLSELGQIPQDFPLEKLVEKLRKKDKSHNILLVHIAASLQSEVGDRLLKDLLDQGSDAVRSLCISKIGEKQREALYDRLLSETLNSQHRKVAFEAISRAALEVQAAKAYLLDQVVPQLASRIIRGLIHRDTKESTATLRELLSRNRVWFSAVILSELERAGKTSTPLADEARKGLPQAQLNFLRLRLAGATAENPLVAQQIDAEASFASQVLFCTLRLNYPKERQRLYDIEKSINSSEPRQVNAAIELLENWCPASLAWLPLALEKKTDKMRDLIPEKLKNELNASPSELLRAIKDEKLLKSIATLEQGKTDTPEEALMTRAMHLRNSGFFKNLATEIIIEIARMGEELTVGKGQELFHEGDAGDGLYFVMEGELDVLIKEKRVNNLEPGAVLGEIALLDQGPRTATIRASSDSTLIRISPKMFDDMIQEYPQVAKQVAATLVGHIRRLVPHVETN